jgi:hypothetical protein
MTIRASSGFLKMSDKRLINYLAKTQSLDTVRSLSGDS